MIMGTLDNTHFPWVHGGILGSKGEINQLMNLPIFGFFLEIMIEVLKKIRIIWI